jgi:hypothetical protein
MMLCVDKKRLHDSVPGQEPVRSRARAEPSGIGAEYLPEGHAGPPSLHQRRRYEVLLRVVRISDALNQRLAL